MSSAGAVPVGGVVAAVRSDASVPGEAVVALVSKAPRALATMKTRTASAAAASNPFDQGDRRRENALGGFGGSGGGAPEGVVPGGGVQ
jgi:hypothetical protein